MKQKQVACWESEGLSNRRCRLKDIEHFDARGKRCIYGRIDKFAGRGSYNMTIWKDKIGRLLVRFWSHKSEVDWMSYELTGIKPESIPESVNPYSLDNDQYIPQVLRKEYDNWIISEF